MGPFLLGAAVLGLLVWGLYGFRTANPQALARGLRTLGGIVALALAGFLSVRGQIGIGLPLGVAGLALLGWTSSLPAMFGGNATKTPGQVSRVRTAFIEMELAHDTGAMQGRILAGPYEGTTLDALNVPTLMRMLGDIDEESRALLAAYLDRRDARWRENAQGDATAGHGRPPDGGPMTQEEAYQVLGLQPGAAADEIARAHRSLMKKLHPDQGGSTYLAARVNQAKDVLLRRHR